MHPRRLASVLIVVALACVLLTASLAIGRSLLEEEPADRGSTTLTSQPAEILADWDARRARAWARGDVDGLAALYADTSRAGEVDVALLQDYVDRGLRVEGLETQVLALQVEQHSDDVLEVVVTDRVVGGRAVGSSGEVDLPRDRPSVRRVTMREVDGVWLVAEVRDQPRAAARTSETSVSAKS